MTAARIRHDQRWPTYIPRALPHGLRSQVAVRLHRDDGPGTIGGLNLYSTSSEEIDSDDITVAALFATHAAVALGRAGDQAQMNEAIVTRQRIGQAIGIVMERYDVDEEAAQAFLWRASSHAHVKVRDIADKLVAERRKPRRDLRH